MQTIAIIYHDADFDGLLSNEVCRFHLGKLYPTATIHSHGWDYGRMLPEAPCNPEGHPVQLKGWASYDAIYIVDLSIDELMARGELRDKIVWIDHHKTAIDKWKDSGFKGSRIDGVAACRLCWQWFGSGQTNIQPWFNFPLKQEFIDRSVDEPLLIRLAGEYDIWDHRDPDAKALQFGLRTLNQTELHLLAITQFTNTENRDEIFIPVIAQGKVIQTYCNKQNAEYAEKYSRTLLWEGLSFCCLNTGQRGNSDLFTGGLHAGHHACFSWRHDGENILVSLYHSPGNEHVDLSVIAAKYGGGGHRGACGFRVTLRELADILG